MNGAEIVRFQVASASISAVANLVVSIALTRRIGLSGPIWGSVLTQAVAGIPAYILIRRRYFTDVSTSGSSPTVVRMNT
jgi:O-antigen/teichoic acid export membrane protein